MNDQVQKFLTATGPDRFFKGWALEIAACLTALDFSKALEIYDSAALSYKLVLEAPCK